MRKCQSYCFAETVHIRAINSISVSETDCPGSASPDNRTSESEREDTMPDFYTHLGASISPFCELV